MLDRQSSPQQTAAAAAKAIQRRDVNPSSVSSDIVGGMGSNAVYDQAKRLAGVEGLVYYTERQIRLIEHYARHIEEARR